MWRGAHTRQAANKRLAAARPLLLPSKGQGRRLAAKLLSTPDLATADKIIDLRNMFQDAYIGWLEIYNEARKARVSHRPSDVKLKKIGLLRNVLTPTLTRK